LGKGESGRSRRGEDRRRNGSGRSRIVCTEICAYICDIDPCTASMISPTIFKPSFDVVCILSFSLLSSLFSLLSPIFVTPLLALSVRVTLLPNKQPTNQPTTHKWRENKACISNLSHLRLSIHPLSSKTIMSSTQHQHTSISFHPRSVCRKVSHKSQRKIQHISHIYIINRNKWYSS